LFFSKQLQDIVFNLYITDDYSFEILDHLSSARTG